MRNKLLQRPSQTGWYTVFICDSAIGIFEFFDDVRPYLDEYEDEHPKIKKFKSFAAAHEYVYTFIPKSKWAIFGIDQGYLRVNRIQIK